MKANLKNLRRGDLITRMSVIAPRTDTSFIGRPMKITAISLPFIYGDLWDTGVKTWDSSKWYTIDTREWEVMRVSKNAISKPTIDRKNLPAWFKWAAMDASGDWYVYIPKPKLLQGDNIWTTGNNSDMLALPQEYAPKWNGNMEDSLIELDNQE